MPTLSWNASTGATTYRVQVSSSSSFTSFVVDDSTLTGTSRQVSGLSYISTYYWRVNAKNSSGTSDWSTAWSFTTLIPPPGAFTLLSPANGATGQATSGTLSWQASTNATAYDVYLDGNNPPTTVVSSNQTATSYSYAGLSNSTAYYWRVVAKNSTGTTSATSSPWSFVTAAPPLPAPGAFALSSPANGATGQANSGSLTWQASSNAAGYDVYLGTANPPTSLVSSNQASTSYSYSGLSYGTTYYWKVVAKNATGSTTATGSPWAFSTQAAPPAAFGSPTPAANATGQPTSGTLSWQASANATVYDVYFGSTNPPTAIVSANQTGTSYGYSGLSNNTSYYWTVVAKNSAGSTAGTGTPWKFTTVKKGKPKLSAFVLNFGIMQPGTPKKDSFMLYNIGDTTLSLQSIVIDNAVFKANPTSANVEVADSQKFLVQASTSTLAAETGTIIINYEDGVDPDTVYAYTSSVLGVKQGNGGLPDKIALQPNFPNPFNPATTISYQLTSQSRVTLKIYNLLGQLAATLKDGVEEAGYKSTVWNADQFASGIYFYRLEVAPLSGKDEPFTQMRKMILAK